MFLSVYLVLFPVSTGINLEVMNNTALDMPVPREYGD